MLVVERMMKKVLKRNRVPTEEDTELDGDFPQTKRIQFVVLCVYTPCDFF